VIADLPPSLMLLTMRIAVVVLEMQAEHVESLKE